MVKRVITYIILSGSILLAGLAGAQPARVDFLPHWFPQAQFAGFYVAQQQGFYRDANLEVTILTGGPGEPVYEALNRRKVHIVSGLLSGAIEAHDAGIPLVNIAQLLQHSSLAFVARRQSGITELIDFNHQRIGLWRSGFQELPRLFLKMHSLEPERIVPINATISLFLNGGVDLLTVMDYNEYHQLIMAGVDSSEMVPFRFRDFGLDIPEDGLYCLRSFLDENPTIVKRFVAATMKGWAWAFANEDKALDLVIEKMKAANVPHNKAHQRWMLRRMKQLMVSGTKLCPPLTRQTYQSVNALLFDFGVIKRLQPFSDFCPSISDHVHSD